MQPLTGFEEIIEEKAEEDLTDKIEEQQEQKEEVEDVEDKVEDQEQDDYDKLDIDIRKMIDTKIQETTDIMRREVGDRKSYLEDKLDEILNPKKEKKKKK